MQKKRDRNVPNEIHILFVMLNPAALRKAKIVYTFGLSECNRVKGNNRAVCLEKEYVMRTLLNYRIFVVRSVSFKNLCCGPFLKFVFLQENSIVTHLM